MWVQSSKKFSVLQFQFYQNNDEKGWEKVFYHTLIVSVKYLLRWL